MSLLNPTRSELVCDPQGRPYFLWDCEMTLDEFRAQLGDRDRETRAYLIGKLMRQAKPDDVFEYVTVGDIVSHWDALQRHLGRSRPFWVWLLRMWGVRQ